MKQLSYWQIAGLVLSLLSYFVLFPGVTQPLMTLSATVNFFGFQGEVFNETRSIIETVKELAHLGYPFIGGLVLTFSVIIPAIKLLLSVIAVFGQQAWLWKVVSVISKWSMADVFVVASLIAYFTAKSTVELQAELHSGFYWFLGYCLLSILSGQLLLMAKPKYENNSH